MRIRMFRMSVTGRVVSATVVVLDEPLPEGAAVRVNLCDEEGFELSAEAEDELLESISQADRGESVPIEQVLRSLKNR